MMNINNINEAFNRIIKEEFDNKSQSAPHEEINDSKILDDKQRRIQEVLDIISSELGIYEFEEESFGEYTFGQADKSTLGDIGWALRSHRFRNTEYHTYVSPDESVTIYTYLEDGIGTILFEFGNNSLKEDSEKKERQPRRPKKLFEDGLYDEVYTRLSDAPIYDFQGQKSMWPFPKGQYDSEKELGVDWTDSDIIIKVVTKVEDNKLDRAKEIAKEYGLETEYVEPNNSIGKSNEMLKIYVPMDAPSPFDEKRMAEWEEKVKSFKDCVISEGFESIAKAKEAIENDEELQAKLDSLGWLLSYITIDYDTMVKDFKSLDEGLRKLPRPPYKNGQVFKDADGDLCTIIDNYNGFVLYKITEPEGWFHSSTPYRVAKAEDVTADWAPTKFLSSEQEGRKFLYSLEPGEGVWDKDIQREKEEAEKKKTKTFKPDKNEKLKENLESDLTSDLYNAITDILFKYKDYFDDSNSLKIYVKETVPYLVDKFFVENPNLEESFEEWKPNLNAKHIIKVLNDVIARDGKYINNELEEVTAAMKKLDRYKLADRVKMRDLHRKIWLMDREKSDLTEEIGYVGAYCDGCGKKNRVKVNFKDYWPPFDTTEFTCKYCDTHNSLTDPHVYDDEGHVINEDTIKKNGKWVNKGKDGTHGTFKTKKAADAQRKAMFANGYKESKPIKESVSHSFSLGDAFENSGKHFTVYDIKGDYTLIYSDELKFMPYIVAWKLSNDGTWGQGRYFKNKEDAEKYLSERAE